MTGAAPTIFDELCDDLLAERADLDAILASTASAGWQTPTPAEGWNVLDQVTHLAWFDQAARTSIVDPEAFRSQQAAMLQESKGAVEGFVETVRASHAHLSGSAARRWLHGAGDSLLAAARDADPSERVPWYGPAMTVTSCITARLMETWAHGQDIADAVGVERIPTQRLKHVAFIGSRAFVNSFRAHGLAVPDVAVRVSLTAPDGSTWDFGPRPTDSAADPAIDTVTGPALDFCLLVTQRRHRADTSLVATGDTADRWLDIAQAFAGPPGAGRPPSDRIGSKPT